MHGQDKGLLEWRGKPLLEHVLQALQTDRHHLVISANRNIERYESYGYPVLHDCIGDYRGPLVGILTAMRHCDRDYLLCIPCDCPKPPTQLISRLADCMQGQDAPCAVCHDGVRLQPLFSLLSRDLQSQLECFLDDGRRKVHDFFREAGAAICDFSDQQQHFRNFNHLEDLQ